MQVAFLVGAVVVLREIVTGYVVVEFRPECQTGPSLAVAAGNVAAHYAHEAGAVISLRNGGRGAIVPEPADNVIASQIAAAGYIIAGPCQQQ